MGERLNGIQEVGGSIPPGSTKFFNMLGGEEATLSDVNFALGNVRGNACGVQYKGAAD